jgi:hypothetical protein
MLVKNVILAVIIGLVVSGGMKDAGQRLAAPVQLWVMV